MIILAIETSCDDTCISVVKDFSILSNVISSQIEIHKPWGGVFPALAKREHQKNLVPVLKQSLQKAKLLKTKKQQQIKKEKLAKILVREPDLYEELIEFLKKYQKPRIARLAVTIGPGLEPCLWTGVNFAKALSCYWNIPIIPINHIEAHIFANFIEKTKIKFPAIALVVSGGHTQLLLMKTWGKYRFLGETRDDAAGECFDKTARILGLSYPGGPNIAKIAARTSDIKLPRPMIYSKDYDFSFSGLKTAVLYNFKERRRNSKKYIQGMCAEIQQAIIDVLIRKTLRAAEEYKAKTIILGGGVTANKELKKQFKTKIRKDKLNFAFQAPAAKFCTDNGAMVGIAANYYQQKTKFWRNIKANGNLRIN